MHTISPLRYPGGKNKMLPYIRNIIKNNDFNNHYFEPYGGGASIALGLLFNSDMKHVHINEYDADLYNFWYSVLNHTDDLINKINSTEINVEQYYKQKEILNSDNSNILDSGFSALFINRTSFSGILKAGMLGGKYQNGSTKVYSRFNKNDIIKKIKLISEKKNHISLYNNDAVELLKNANDVFPKDTFIYLDPPYFDKGKSLYRKYYELNDHLKLSKCLQSIDFGFSWLLSYDNVDEIKNMYSGRNISYYDLNYSIKTKYTGKEIVIYSNNIII